MPCASPSPQADSVVFGEAGASWELYVWPVPNAGHPALPLQGCSRALFSPAGFSSPRLLLSIPPVFTQRGMKTKKPWNLQGYGLPPSFQLLCPLPVFTKLESWYLKPFTKKSKRCLCETILPSGRAGLQFTNTWCGCQLWFYKHHSRYLQTSLYLFFWHMEGLGSLQLPTCLNIIHYETSNRCIQPFVDISLPYVFT